MSTERAIVPDTYAIVISPEEGIVLRVRTTEAPFSEPSGVSLSMNDIFARISDTTTVEMAANELAYRLDTLAAELRRMAPRLPSLENK
jgi:hypothetical protein